MLAMRDERLEVGDYRVRIEPLPNLLLRRWNVHYHESMCDGNPPVPLVVAEIWVYKGTCSIENGPFVFRCAISTWLSWKDVCPSSPNDVAITTIVHEDDVSLTGIFR